MGNKRTGPYVIEINFDNHPQIPLDKSWFTLNNRLCRLLGTDIKDFTTRLGRFEYEDGEKFTVTKKILYESTHEREEHSPIYWNRIVGWSLCKSNKATHLNTP